MNRRIMSIMTTIVMEKLTITTTKESYDKCNDNNNNNDDGDNDDNKQR